MLELINNATTIFNQMLHKNNSPLVFVFWFVMETVQQEEGVWMVVQAGVGDFPTLILDLHHLLHLKGFPIFHLLAY
jgi:hypothetical protein